MASKLAVLFVVPWTHSQWESTPEISPDAYQKSRKVADQAGSPGSTWPETTI